MKLSTKGRYGLRAMTHLAVYAQNSHVSLGFIGEKENISVSYLEHLFSLLKKAGLVRSVKGAQGGYMLARPADRMCVGDVVRALEGEITLLEGNGTGSLNDALSQTLRETLWDKADFRMNRLLDSITLEELAEDKRTMDGLTDPMYHI